MGLEGGFARIWLRPRDNLKVLCRRPWARGVVRDQKRDDAERNAQKVESVACLISCSIHAS